MASAPQAASTVASSASAWFHEVTIVAGNGSAARTNTGDLMSDGLGLGHVAGLPWIIGALVLVFIVERTSPWKTAIFFWAAIIIIRTGATNIGDAFHDYKIDFSISLPIVLACYIVAVLIYRTYWLRSGSTSVSVNAIYWITMILAGVLGTIGGDAASFRLSLTPAGTAVLFFAFAAWQRPYGDSAAS
ncbi:hypothetical protein NKI46_25445 [Mesorhizobium sp. M0615]|uniref:hypothetical protein n=1 Tax=Mesorhizobium sp. M0615 TaxID=2956971 RepID=UPI00333C42BE